MKGVCWCGWCYTYLGILGLEKEEHLPCFVRGLATVIALHQQEIAQWPEFLGDGHLANGPARLRRDHATDAVEQCGCMVGPIQKPGGTKISHDDIYIYINDDHLSLYSKASLRFFWCVERAKCSIHAGVVSELQDLRYHWSEWIGVRSCDTVGNVETTMLERFHQLKKDQKGPENPWTSLADSLSLRDSQVLVI